MAKPEKPTAPRTTSTVISAPDANDNAGHEAGAGHPVDPADAKRWDAVEEATELLNEERYHEALVELRDVLRSDPKNAYAFYFLGVALFETGELEAARDAYRATLKNAPQHLGAKVALTHVLRSLGDLREAIKIGTEALEQEPGDADVLYAIGQAYLARGDNAAARRYLEAFLQARPEFELSVEVTATLEGLKGPRALN